MRVAQEAGDSNFIHGQSFGFLLGTLRFGLLAKGVDGRDAQHVAFELPRQAIVL